jgi:hypothetical protein
MELEEDRLSSLPRIILPHILSLLPEKDVARTSVFSKVVVVNSAADPSL